MKREQSLNRQPLKSHYERNNKAIPAVMREEIKRGKRYGVAEIKEFCATTWSKSAW